MTRSSGFYSLCRHDGTWTVAEWRVDAWWVCGDSHPFHDNHWASIDGRIEDARHMSMQRETLKREYDRLKSAVDTIPAAIMLLGGPPYKLTFTESCLREIAESQK